MFPATNQSASDRLILLILIVAAVLRLHGLTAFSLSNDELSALARLQFDTFAEVIAKGVYIDFHPAGVHTFLHLWTSVFGFSEWMVRIPFALMGIASVYFIYRIGDIWFGRATGLLAAAAFAVLDYPLLYSQIARPYSPGLLVGLIMVFFWTKALFLKSDTNAKQRISFIGFALAVSACMYTHYFSFLFAGIVCFSGLFFLRKETRIPYLLSGVLIVLLYLPHLDIFMHQVSKGGLGGPDGWLGPPGSDALSKYIAYCFNDSYQLKLIFLIMMGGTLLVFRHELKLHKFHILSIIFFAVPFAVAYFYSIWKNPVFQHSVLLFSFPYLLLLIFSFIPREKTGTTMYLMLFVILTGGIYSTVIEKKYYSSQHFTEFRKIAIRTIELDTKLGKDSITRTISVFDPYYINYYLQLYGHNNTYEITKIISEEEKRQFYRIIEQSDTPWFLYSYSNIYDPPEFDMIIRSKYPWLVVRDSMLNSGLRLYSRMHSDTALNRLPVQTIHYGFENGQWENENTFHDSSIIYDGFYSVKIGNNAEYGPALNKKMYDVGVSPGSQVEVNASFYSNEQINSAKLVLSIEKDGKSLHWTATGIGQYMHKENEWFRVFMVADIPVTLTGDEDFKIYCWNEKLELLWMDDFRMNSYSPRR